MPQHLPDATHLADEGLAEVTQASHDVAAKKQGADGGAPYEGALLDGVGAGNGKQDGQQQEHTDDREETASPFLSLLLHLPECDSIVKERK